MQSKATIYTIKQALYNAVEIFTGRGIQHWSIECFCKGNCLAKDHLLLFVEAGQLDIQFGHTLYHVEKQQLVFVRKDTCFQYESCATPLSMIVFELKYDIIVGFVAMLNLRTRGEGTCLPLLTGDTSELLREYMSSLQLYFNQYPSLSASLTRMKLVELLICLSANDRSFFEQLLFVKESIRPDITRLVEENLTNAISLNQLARLAGRSVSSLRRDFISIYNMPPSRWIRQKKLERAKELLVNTDMTVTSICYTLGFESVAHFSRAFKSYFRYSPSGLREGASVATT
ncbi:helix-turn-helix domain-containing protein [Chitinophaga pinensis]|uniref:Transcriptional regulator, AraC family n=1 Tax=Chitinophaga pinensis (strain ATCC 43595 / DSM 2588 / LMG 13176 / NBRC 15968 / NCIMB 11800 / UQM 2034) TaxID=485918 RepID=A0A979G6L4_CHIPD|nr:transcriptional regulator, AraC family [Chitinophaga pinensis DSM 2588]